MVGNAKEEEVQEYNDSTKIKQEKKKPTWQGCTTKQINSV